MNKKIIIFEENPRDLFLFLIDKNFSCCFSIKNIWRSRIIKNYVRILGSFNGNLQYLAKKDVFLVLFHRWKRHYVTFLKFGGLVFCRNLTDFVVCSERFATAVFYLGFYLVGRGRSAVPINSSPSAAGPAVPLTSIRPITIKISINRACIQN